MKAPSRFICLIICEEEKGNARENSLKCAMASSASHDERNNSHCSDCVRIVGKNREKNTILESAKANNVTDEHT